MTESQSRFSIVQELTEKKFEIDRAMEEGKQKIENLRNSTKRYIEQKQEELVLAEERTERQYETLKQQKGEIDKALKALEALSEKKQEKA